MSHDTVDRIADLVAAEAGIVEQAMQAEQAELEALVASLRGKPEAEQVAVLQAFAIASADRRRAAWDRFDKAVAAMLATPETGVAQ
jgi:hypothetical protein